MLCDRLHQGELRKAFSCQPFDSYEGDLSKKLNQTTEQINSLAFQSARERLLTTLQQMAKDHGVATKRGLAIQVPLTHQDIASIINVSRPTVTNLLLQLRHEGILEIVDHRMVLKGKDQAAS